MSRVSEKSQEVGPGGLTLTEIGSRLRQLREGEGITLITLAEQVNLSKGYLSLIESGKKRPHWSTLMRIVHTLNSTLCEFLLREEDLERGKEEVQEGGGERTIRLAGNLPDQWGQVARGDEEGYTWIVTRQKEPYLRSEVLRFRLPPHTSWTPEPIVLRGSIVAYGLEGSTLLETGRTDRDEFTLQPGRTLSLDGRVPHRFRNPTDVPTEVLLVVTPPAV